MAVSTVSTLAIFFCFVSFVFSINRPLLYKITDEVLIHGECPTWDSRNNILYYVDIHIGKIFRYNSSSETTSSITVNGEVAPVIPSKTNPDRLIIGLNTSIVAVEWSESDEIKQEVILTVAGNKSARMNDGKADKEGRIWFGTMNLLDTDYNQGELYRISSGKDSEIMVAPVNISNGMAWNKENNKFYYIDSPTLKISVFDYDNSLGAISNRKTLIDLEEYNITAHPDGMTIDRDDNLWVALYGGGSVIKIETDTGKLTERYPIPASCVTSVMWGGPQLDILYITTSKISLTPEEALQQPGAGHLYALTNLGTGGVPVFEANIS